ncbi:MAG: glycosyltransferase family 4 protein [Phycisphaerales bacterium]|nr:glycosyltransferase family 4 protein [Phycisphaerales bacterium]
MNKRITIICSSYPPETGAAPTRIFHLANMLRNKGNEVTVITSMPNYPTGKIFTDYRKKIISQEQLNGIRVFRTTLIPTNSSNKIKRIISGLSYASSFVCLALPKIIRSKPQLLVISSPPFITGYLGTFLGSFTHARVLLNISDLWPSSALDLGFVRKGFLYRILLRLEQKMYERSDFFSAQSEEIKNHLLHTQCDKNVFVYRNLQPNSLYANMDRPVGKRKIVYAGLLGIAQGVLNIISKVDFGSLNTELHIYGQGFELAKIKEWIAVHPNAAVYYHGSAPSHQIPKILRQYHAMLIPLSSEIHGAVPSKIFNAIANGLPILYCGSGEGTEIIRQNKIGFVAQPGDAIALQQNIGRLISLTEDDYQSMRNCCIHLSQNEFDKAKQDGQFISFLEDNLK